MTSVTELPFNRLMGIEQAQAPQILRLPAGEQFLNHLDTVHASAQLALAEASSGEFLLRHFGLSADVLPVVRRLEAKFRNPARGAITSTVTCEAKIDSVRDELVKKGRAFIKLAVELHDESGAHSLSASVEWFLTRVSAATKS